MSLLDASRVVAETAALVRIDSQNPGSLEHACAGWARRRLAESGLEVASVPAVDGRDNLVATIRGNGEGPRLVLLAHMDTVPVGDGWSVAPLGGLVRDGRLYGRGAADMKSGLALALNLLAALSSGPPPPADVVLCATVDEEAPDMAGAQALVRSGLFRETDQVLALEPTGLRLRIAQLGLRWVEVTAHGRMAHAGRAHLGVDANHVMARLVDRLKQRVASLPYDDELLGRPRFTCGTVEGGVAVNVVPARCVARFDLRFVPPLTEAHLFEMVREVAGETVSEIDGARVDLQPLGPPRPPIRADEGCHLVSRLREAFSDVTGTAMLSGGPDGHEAYTDASMVAALTGSTSCTVFGPGSSDVAHSADEFVDVEDIEIACRVLEKVVEGW
jgi:succinyl-diaminopimelate desuccinylase